MFIEFSLFGGLIIDFFLDLNLALFSASSLEALAAIKLQPAEEGTTLWQIRCPDAGLRTELKSHFS